MTDVKNAAKDKVLSEQNNYVTRVHASPLDIAASEWNALLLRSDAPTPFMRHEYLAAMHASGSATADTGWKPQFIALHDAQTEALLAACPLYVKTHSYGEYIFDWAWARAYQQHGLNYYPKAVVAVPFTPVPGSRFLAINGSLRASMLNSLLSFCEQTKVSSLHALFTSDDDQQASSKLMPRQTVQFHWTNMAPTLPASHGALPPEGALAARGDPAPLKSTTPTLPASHGALPPEGALAARGSPAPLKFASFEAYLATLEQSKRKKIRAEQRKVREAGITWRVCEGRAITAGEWDFFYQCYERTYLEHGNPPYLTEDFFRRMADHMPEDWVLFIAQHEGRDVACSLIAVNAWEQSNATNSIANCAGTMRANGHFSSENQAKKVAYGRYWGALARVDSLHFDACYYQPLQWCIERGYDRFEGGAQGEHKMARGLLPVVTHSRHWLAHPQFADAVERFLEREREGIDAYAEELQARSPFKNP
jgi:uncharacterized protein